MSKVTIYDVAGAAKVSLATVSRVLNNPEKVKPETRDRVNKIIKDLGYRANAIARGLASRKSTTVGVLLSDVTRASVAEMLDGILDIAKKYDYTIKLFSFGVNDDLDDTLRSVISEQVDGVLYLNDELDDSEIKKIVDGFLDNMVPVVFCNVITDDENVPVVAIDYEQAAYQITKRMIENGKKKIYFASTARRYSINAKKELGYQKAMEEANLTSHIIRTTGDTSKNRPYFKEVLQTEEIDAFIGSRDSIALSFLNVAQEEGFHVPDDIMVAGFQNTKYALLSRPLMTCVNMPVYDLGAVSMRLLTKFMKDESVTEKKILLPHDLVIRQTA